MCTRSLPLAFLLVSTALNAQDPSVVYHTPRQQYAFPEEASPEYVLRSGSALRSAPSADAGLVTALPAGQPVMVEERGDDTLRMEGVLSHWYRVSTGGRSGWTWGGNLAQFAFGSTADASVKFVAGLDHYAPPDTDRVDVSYRLVAVKEGKELDRIVLRSFAWGFDEVRNVGNLGLRNVDDVIILPVPCVGGCGCTTGEVVVFWSGGRFHHVADLMGSPDGDYSTNVRFIFPSDIEGEDGVIIRETSDYQDLEDAGAQEEEEEELPEGNYIERIVRKERLAWTGSELVPKGAPGERRYRMHTGPY